MLLFRGEKTRGKRVSKDEELEFEIDFFRGLVRRDPRCVEALQILGDAYTQTGQWQRGLQIDRKLARLCPHNPLVFYNLACSYALLNQLDEAFGSLNKALRLGYDDLRWLMRDPDLANLRQDSRFKRIRDTLRKKHGPTRRRRRG